MTPQDRLSILLTFGIGVIVGGYLYLSGFSTTFKLPDAPTESQYGGLVVVAESYGDCLLDFSCISVQVLNDRSYRVLYDTAASGERDVTKTGNIPRAQSRALQFALTPAILEVESQLAEVYTCRYEGTNYRFRISLEGQGYLIDTCSSNVNYDGVVWQNLSALWNYFIAM